jgi:hypothetical protein
MARILLSARRTAAGLAGLSEMTPKENVHDPETDPKANAELDRS